MKFGNHNQIACIAEEVGGVVEAAPEEAQVELFDALIDGCKESVETGNFEPKVKLEIKHLNGGSFVFLVVHLDIFNLPVFYSLQGPVLDFFGVPVKANELLKRVQGLQLLSKRISRYDDPISQFRVLSYLKPSNWSKGCGWNQSMCNLIQYYHISICLIFFILILFDIWCSKSMMRDCFLEYFIMVLGIGKR